MTMLGSLPGASADAAMKSTSFDQTPQILSFFQALEAFPSGDRNS
jgi:hypothetical protein